MRVKISFIDRVTFGQKLEDEGRYIGKVSSR